MKKSVQNLVKAKKGLDISSIGGKSSWQLCRICAAFCAGSGGDPNPSSNPNPNPSSS